MNEKSLSYQRYLRRQNRTRQALATQKSLPRLSVHRSLRHMSAQIIDDTTGWTLVAYSDATLKTGKKTERAAEIGKSIAAQAKEKKISAVRFDRGAYRYHGRIAALAEAARQNGLTF